MAPGGGKIKLHIHVPCMGRLSLADHVVFCQSADAVTSKSLLIQINMIGYMPPYTPCPIGEPGKGWMGRQNGSNVRVRRFTTAGSPFLNLP